MATTFDSAAGDRAAASLAARDYYYRGPIAEAIVAVWDELVVYQNPPNSQGMTQLLTLNILKGLNLAQHGPDDPEAIHLQVEAIKLAFADLLRYVGDPDRVDIPVADLLSDAHAEEQRARIDPAVAMEWPMEITLGRTSSRAAPAHTTTFHIVDRAGNAAAVTLEPISAGPRRPSTIVGTGSGSRGVGRSRRYRSRGAPRRSPASRYGLFVRCVG